MTGYKVLTVTDASRGVDAGTTDAALKDMQSIGKWDNSVVIAPDS